MLKIIIALFLMTGSAQAFDYNSATDDQIVDAIGKAENSKSHPYGIMKKYKNTTPRQACFNTVRHARRDWDGKGDFISFLQKRYAPVGVSNDPKGLNKNWEKNVKFFLQKGEK